MGCCVGNLCPFDCALKHRSYILDPLAKESRLVNGTVELLYDIYSEAPVDYCVTALIVLARELILGRKIAVPKKVQLGTLIVRLPLITRFEGSKF